MTGLKVGDRILYFLEGQGIASPAGQEAYIRELSPSGKYARLGNEWFAISQINVIEFLNPEIKERPGNDGLLPSFYDPALSR